MKQFVSPARLVLPASAPNACKPGCLYYRARLARPSLSVRQMMTRLWRGLTKPTAPLYIFAHLQKTAGSAFRKNVQESLAPEEFLEIYLGGQLKDAQHIERLLETLPPERKSKIKLILGHHVYFGMHSHFARKAKYIIFLRDPVARTISHYNYCRTDQALGGRNHHPSVTGPDGRLLDFQTWFAGNPSLHNFTTRFLVRFYRGTPPEPELGPHDLQTARKALKRFYFVGLTERYSENVSCLYQKLGIKGVFKEVNVSQKHLEPDNSVLKVVREHNLYDLELYELARKLNRKHLARLWRPFLSWRLPAALSRRLAGATAVNPALTA